jgi:tRNA pseudouridine38-40 synthase
MKEYTYKLHLTYDGTNYSGWQIQKHSLSIQQIVQDAVRIIAREDVNLIGSGRTDAGVHALDQVAHFRSHTELDLAHFVRSMNGLLPKDIRLKEVEFAPATFHAQQSAKAKEYHYRLALGHYVSPFEERYCWHARFDIDEPLLKAAAALFIGTHDFRSFANSQAKGAAAKNPTRTIWRLDVVPREGGLTLEFEGNGFLYKMVRNIVGTLVQVASKKRPIEDIPRIFAAHDRRVAPMAAPAQGLFLVKVTY